LTERSNLMLFYFLF